MLEAVFIALLQHEASRGSLLAGLIAYRAIYFILPLLVAGDVPRGGSQGQGVAREEDAYDWMMLKRSPTTISVIQSTRIEV